MIRDGLNRLGFEVIKGAEFYQLAKRLGGSRYVKVDFLGEPLGQYEDPSRVKVDSRRVKPKPSVGLHAHRSAEAVAYDLEPIAVSLTGTRSIGEEAVYVAPIPQAFSYLMMKLFAFLDGRPALAPASIRTSVSTSMTSIPYLLQSCSENASTVASVCLST